ncbi:MAG: hypothetical protein JNK64_24900 [Myxococcales bacterium]|nr:hypothetical protein [Myxococcales bacterium]
MLAVLATDNNTGAEPPAFCRYDSAGNLDPKGPSLVQGFIICPDTKAEFDMTGPAELEPLAWNVRTMFDELLNGDKVETLVDSEPDAQGNPLPCTADSVTCDGHIGTTDFGATLPFDVSCGGTAITYDGYYYPNGNKESNPVGPALVLAPIDLAPTDTDCQFTIKPAIVIDKQGEAVPTGPNENVFTIHVKPLDVVETDPVDADAVADRAELGPTDPVLFFFNSLVDDASIAAAEIEIKNLDTNAVIPSDFTIDPDGDGNLTLLAITPVAALPPGNYAASIKGGAIVSDIVGGTRTFTDGVSVRFVVAP